MRQGYFMTAEVLHELVRLGIPYFVRIYDESETPLLIAMSTFIDLKLLGRNPELIMRMWESMQRKWPQENWDAHDNHVDAILVMIAQGKPREEVVEALYTAFLKPHQRVPAGFVDYFMPRKAWSAVFSHPLVMVKQAFENNVPDMAAVYLIGLRLNGCTEKEAELVAYIRKLSIALRTPFDFKAVEDWVTLLQDGDPDTDSLLRKTAIAIRILVPGFMPEGGK